MGLHAIGSVRQSMVRIELMVSLMGIVLLGWLVGGCTPGSAEVEEALATKATMEVIASTPKDTPRPVATATSKPTSVVEQGLQVFRTLLIIQANAEQLQEVARQALESQGVENLEASTVLMSLSASILSVDDLLLNVQPPEGTRLSWLAGSSVQQEMITVLQRWLKGEIDASQVVEVMDGLIEDISQEVNTVEGLLVDKLGYDYAGLEQERQAVFGVMKQMFRDRGE